jgi:hypothetical protein
VVIMFAIGAKVRSSNPADGDGFLRAFKICSAPSFDGDVKPSVPCDILRHVKEPNEYERDTS